MMQIYDIIPIINYMFFVKTYKIHTF